MNILIAALAAILYLMILGALTITGKLVLVFWTIILPITVLLIILRMAKMDFFFTYVKENTVKFITRGEAFHTMLMSMEKRRLVGEGREATITECDEGKEFSGSWILTDLLWKWFGIRYWGIPGIHEIHSFKVRADKLKGPQTISKEDRISDFVQHPKEPRNVEELRIRFPRPIPLMNVECGKDGVRVDMILVVELEVVKPYLSVMVWESEFIQQIERWVISRLLVAMKTYTYKSFLAAKKEPGSPFSKKLSRQGDDDDDDILKEYGIRINQVHVPYADISPGQSDIEDALRAEQVAIAEGKATIATAEAKAKAITIEGDAIAAATRARLFVKTDLGVDPNVAAKTDAKVEALGKVPGLRVLVEDGSGSGTNVNVDGGSND